MAALTAKATKASTQEMASTFTTGYGSFRPIMADMTDMQWASAFSGAMAQTVASFKTNGQQMAEAIKNISVVWKERPSSLAGMKRSGIPVQ